MRIAIIGAGLAGIASAVHLTLQSNAKITLFDPCGVGGGGASKIAAGLLHPYVGEKGKRSQDAALALHQADLLLRLAQKKTTKKIFTQGLYRFAMNEIQCQNFVSHQTNYGDIKYIGKTEGFAVFRIFSGYSIDINNYLKALWAFCRERGAVFEPVEIERLSTLEDFDRIIVAAGAGIKKLLPDENLKLKFIKGQTITVPYQKDFYSTIGKGYLAVSPNSHLIHLGATYEHFFHSEQPDIVEAMKIIRPRIQSFMPKLQMNQILDCRSAVRVAMQGHYFPQIYRKSQKIYAITGLGSRGLLYHGLIGKNIAEEIVRDH